MPVVEYTFKSALCVWELRVDETPLLSFCQWNGPREMASTKDLSIWVFCGPLTDNYSLWILSLIYILPGFSWWKTLIIITEKWLEWMKILIYLLHYFYLWHFIIVKLFPMNSYGEFNSNVFTIVKSLPMNSYGKIMTIEFLL